MEIVELLTKRVFTQEERKLLNLAIYDSSILTTDKSSVMFIDNFIKAKTVNT